MSITTDFNVLWTEKTQGDRAVEAKALLQNAMWVIEETKSKIQEIINDGVLDTVPVSIKTSLSKAFAVVKTASTSFEDASIKEVLNWSGK